MKELQYLFEKYKDQYDSLKQELGNKEETTKTWSKGDAVDFLLYESQKAGYKKGKLLKKEPLNKDGVVLYVYSGIEVIYSVFYVGNYVSYEIFYFHEPGRSIALTYGNNRVKTFLSRINVVYRENNRQIKNASYYMNNNREAYTESGITYEGDTVMIKERGFMYIGDNNIEVNQDFEIREQQEQEPVILNTVNNLASGVKKTYQVYPKLK